MTSVHEIQLENGTWLFLAPVSGLELSEYVNYEYKLDKVTFISSARLAQRRKRLGFSQKISELKNRAGGLIKDFFSEEKTYATLRLQGTGEELKEQFLKIVREELAILSLSQLGYSRRRYNSSLAMSREYSPSKIRCLLLNTDNNTWTQLNETTGKIQPLLLERRWSNFSKKIFFYNLVQIISGKTRVSKSWRNTIRNASILAGQSQCSSDLPQAFLWNMIAIEMLLTQQGDKYSDSLPERTESFIGWASGWGVQNYEEKIRKVYKKRCGFVHDGNRESIETQDVLFTDDLLLNVIINIVRHPEVFYSKKQLIHFSEKIKAEHLLGIKGKTRPQTFRYLNPNYSEEDYKKI